MMASDDFLPSEADQLLGRTAPTYPTVFGITLTPDLIGMLIGASGLVAFIYIILSLVMPAWQQHQDLETKQIQKQAQIQQLQATLAASKQIKTELAQAKKQQKDVLSLFANEKTLDTLALDLDRVVKDNTANTSRAGVKAKLTKFTPAQDQSNSPIADSSLGPEVNGKLKRQVVEVGIEGTFAQTEAIMRDIERLQPLLIVKDYQSTLKQSSSAQGGRGPITVDTTFKLQALIPINSEQAPTATAQTPK